MRKLFTRELIFLSTCAAVAMAYIGLGYLLAPEVPVDTKIIRVTSIDEISDSFFARKEAVEQRNAFFSAWYRWGMIVGVGVVVVFSLLRTYSSSRDADKSAERRKKTTQISSPPLMSRQAWFYLVASALLLVGLVVVLAVGLSR